MDWESSETCVLLNPRMAKEVQEQISRLLPVKGSFLAHMWLLTSGSTMEPNEYKCVALSKNAILASAKAVNRHLNSGASDKWLNCLPLFHVGGLGIKARAHLSGAQVFDFAGKWDAALFAQQLEAHQITLTSLVPAQVFDLVKINALAPSSLRAVIVGGGALDEHLYRQADELGWPILPSYGMTEVSSGVATASPGSGDIRLQFLEHIEASADENDYIQINSPSLLTAYALIKEGRTQIVDPKVDGWFKTEDRGKICGRHLCVWGRGANFIKVGGESVDLGLLEKLMSGLLNDDCQQAVFLLAVPDERLGHVIHAAVEGKATQSTRLALEKYQQLVMPFERYRYLHEISMFPRSSLGKILKQQILTLIKSSQQP